MRQDREEEEEEKRKLKRVNTNIYFNSTQR
jgi:hypothetical protein